MLWTWTGPDPDFWSLQVFTGGLWSQLDFVDGTERGDTGIYVTGQVASVIGTNNTMSPITPRSNIVVMS